MSALLVPVLLNAHVKAWPLHKDGARAGYLPLAEALRRRFTFDAHTAAYSMPVVPRRLAGEAPQALGGVEMRLALFDIDSPGHMTPPAAWRAELLAAVEKLRRVQPGLFFYETRRGGRICGLREPPIVIASPEDGEAWRRRYRADLGELVRFGIVADASPVITVWTCLFRLPHATRTPGGSPEERRTLGNPYHVGVWTYEPTAAELAPPPPPPPTPTATPSPSSSRYADAALAAEVARVRSAPGGTIFNTVNAAAFNLGCLVATGALDCAVVAAALLDAAEAAARAADKLSSAGKRDSIATIKRAIAAAAAKHPRTVPPPKVSSRPPPHGDADAPPWLRGRAS